jgi:hypothetical protein
MSVGGRLPSAIAAVLAMAFVVPACSAVVPSVPQCGTARRLAIVAQSVPTASYVPCLVALPEGWEVSRFDAESGHTRFSLVPDRGGRRAVDIELIEAERCNVAGATPEPARSEGARTYLRLTSISPRYAGTLFDVFAGGCVRYRFDFDRGPHIPLMEELRGAIGLFPRRQLELDLRRRYGVELNAS